MTPEKFAQAKAIQLQIEKAKDELNQWEHRLTSRGTILSKFEFLPDKVFQSFRHFAILSVKDALVTLEKEFDEL